MANAIKNNKNSVLCEINGVTYFKLISNYQGDRTKNCSLLSNEIDANFYFLRGMDIKKVNFNNDTRELILTRLNGDQLKTVIPEKENFTLDYDKENGVLTVNFADGTTESVDGFLVEKDLDKAIKKILGKSVKVATDGTINGDGRVINPLRLSEVERTGTYAPADYFLDLTDSENKIPEGTYAKGTRIVTKELFSKFGRLYTYDEVEKLKCLLEAHGLTWRIPTKEDWDGLLIAAECPGYCDDECEGIYCHDIDDINLWTGKDAGARAKSITSWAESDEMEDGNSVQGEDNLPDDVGSSTQSFHVVPVGYGEGSRGVLTDEEDSDIEGIGEVASFWTDTPTATVAKTKTQKNFYTRTFSYDSRKVLQESSKPSSRLSIRLVRDYTYDDLEYKEYDSIMGHTVPCVLITNEDTNYSQVWTSINIGFSEVGGVTSDEWNNLEDAISTKGVYFINEWDGSEWIKKQMVPGDSVVIADFDNNSGTTDDRYHEWRVYTEDDGTQVLKDTAEALKEEFQEALDDINDRIDDLEGKLNQEIQDREDGDNELWDALSAETGAREEADEDLQRKIDAEEEARISGDTILQNSLDEEIERAKEEEEELWNALSAETADRMAADEELQDNIDAEEYRATERENAIENALFEEIDRATAAEEALENKINEIDGNTVISGEFVSDESNAVDKLVLTKKNEEKIDINFIANFGELPE